MANDKEKNSRYAEWEGCGGRRSLGWVYRDSVQEVQLASGVRLPKKSQDVKDVRCARA